MVIVQQTTHGAYILAEMDGTISKLRFAAFHIIPYHARWRTNVDLKTFLCSLIPMKRQKIQKMQKMRWRQMRISKIQQGWRWKYSPMMKRMTHNEYRPPLRYCRQINNFRHIPDASKRHTESSVCFR
jgi:hypothetical protein